MYQHPLRKFHRPARWSPPRPQPRYGISPIRPQLDYLQYLQLFERMKDRLGGLGIPAAIFLGNPHY